MDTQPQQIHYTSKLLNSRQSEPRGGQSPSLPTPATTKGGAGSHPAKVRALKGPVSSRQDLDQPPGMWLTRGLPTEPGQGAARRAPSVPLPHPRIPRGSPAGQRRAPPATAAAPEAAGAGREPCQKYLNKQAQRDAIRLVPAEQPAGTLREAARGSRRHPVNRTALPLPPAAAGAPDEAYRALLIPEEPSLILSPRCLTLILGSGGLPLADSLSPSPPPPAAARAADSGYGAVRGIVRGAAPAAAGPGEQGQAGPGRAAPPSSSPSRSAAPAGLQPARRFGELCPFSCLWELPFDFPVLFHILILRWEESIFGLQLTLCILD